MSWYNYIFFLPTVLHLGSLIKVRRANKGKIMTSSRIWLVLNFWPAYMSRIMRPLRCINNDVVVDIRSELLMRLSYYIYRGFGKKLSFHERIEPRSSGTWVVNSTVRPERQLFFYSFFLKLYCSFILSCNHFCLKNYLDLQILETYF